MPHPACTLARKPHQAVFSQHTQNPTPVPKPIKNLFRQFGAASTALFAPVLRWGDWLFALQNRERTQLREEVTRTRGLMPLLMKQRNGYRWTDDDRRNIREHLRHLARISPYIILLAVPGGLLLLPIMAWWLDRRRLKRNADAQRALDESNSK